MDTSVNVTDHSNIAAVKRKLDGGCSGSDDDGIDSKKLRYLPCSGKST